MNGKKLYLSNYDKKLAGVCGGIADFFGIDSTIIRVLWVICSMFFGSGILAYLICWVLIPREPEF